MEKVEEIKTCKHCNSSFEITNKDLDFYEKVSPVFPVSVIASETKQSSVSGLPYLVRDDKIKDLGNGKVKYLIPTPTLCPDCRQQRRLSFRNERNLYKRKCDATGKDIISMFSPDKRYKVYEKKYWDSDKYDPTDYGMDFDFSKTFFEQFKELYNLVPQPRLYQDGEMINSEYASFTGWLKDCYLVNDSGKSENCCYGNLYVYSKSSMDCSFLSHSEGCYECINCSKCYKLYFSQFCIDCRNSSYLNNCIGSEYCFGCKNLVNKNYCIYNVQHTKDEYFKKIIFLNHDKEIKEKVEIFYKRQPSKQLKMVNCDNSIGDILENCKNTFECYECFGMEDVKFCQVCGSSTKDCYDISAFGEDMELCYELSASGGVRGKQSIYNCLFSSYCFYGGANLIYCIGAHRNSNNCFGCTAIKGNSYCILNKQYTKEEYNKLVSKIIEHMMKTGEWGEFFPSSLSPFGYNETVAQEYFPLNRFDVIPANAGIYSKEKLIKGNNDSEILKSNNSKEYSKNFRELIDSGSSQEGQTTNFLHGLIFNWSDYESPKPKVDKIIPANKLPEDIKEIPDDILNWAIMPEDVSNDSDRSQQKPFRIIKEELEFYRKHKLPIPRRHPDQRHLDRMKLRNPRKLYDRSCDKCGKEIKTTYSPERKEIIYCEECYNKEVY